jgi:CRP-like cAMP-binding protein
METQKVSTKSTFWTNLFKAPTESDELEAVLKSMPPFEKLKKKHLHLLMELMHNRLYAENEYIFYQGDPGIGLYIIREGEVSIVHGNKENDQKELARLKKGDFFGELAMFDDEIRSASAVAVKETTVTVIFKPDLQEFIDKFPAIGVNILRGLAQIVAVRLRHLNKEYNDLITECFEK